MNLRFMCVGHVVVSSTCPLCGLWFKLWTNSLFDIKYTIAGATWSQCNFSHMAILILNVVGSFFIIIIADTLASRCPCSFLQLQSNNSIWWLSVLFGSTLLLYTFYNIIARSDVQLWNSLYLNLHVYMDNCEIHIFLCILAFCPQAKAVFSNAFQSKHF